MEGSTSDVVIYIQLEVEDSPCVSSDRVYLEYQRSSLGTQTAESIERDERFSLPEEGNRIRLSEGKHENGESLYQIWKGCDRSSSTVVNSLMLPRNEEEEIVLSVQEPKDKTVTFNEELSEIFVERELQETYPEEEVSVSEGTANARPFVLRNAKQHVDIWFVQQNIQQVQRVEVRKVQQFPVVMDAVPLELQKALKLIREIESDVVGVKLSDAISILPRLETELRKHLQNKMKGLGEKESMRENSLHNFFSVTEFWPEEESVENESETSEDRLNNLLAMLADLEEAVKSSECSANDVDLCQCNSSKIYDLLHALTTSIRELEGRPNMMSLSQTLEIASQLDTAVREYDSIIKRQPVDFGGRRKEESSEEPVMQHLKNVRKKVFGMVQQEAIEVERRIETDFDRLDRLEGENDEALMFLEAFLQKTQRRVADLSTLKVQLKELSSALSKLYENMKEAMTRKEMEVLQIKGPEDNGLLTDSSRDSVGSSLTGGVTKPIRETISGLIVALDSLKSRARFKKEVCREILLSGGAIKAQESQTSSRRSSKSSFTTKNGDQLYAIIKEFKKIGSTSLYLAWSKPDGPLKGSIVGYQIHVNDKLNQKVRNSHRLQAVLYSVDLSGKVDVQLYALTESGPKILLATVTYPTE